MGKRIYQNEYVAIRELIQNALDSCELKMKNEEGYIPEISIELDGNTLVVQDNALGMNRYIVENYFAKLGSSYYCENNIQNSIGQFGVGVFSYFMLCDSFTVETKMEQSEGLKFIVNQEAPYQFYFYQNPVLKEGTRVTVHLKDDVNLILKELINFISTTFKHVKIPLVIKSHKQQSTCILHKDYALDKALVIEDIVEIVHQQKFAEYDFHQVPVDNNEFEGCCGIFFPKNLEGNSSNIRTHYIDEKRGINIFQKGVFIQKSTGVVGDVNLKISRSLKVDRNNFEDDSFLGEILEEFENKLIEIIFSKIQNEFKIEATLFYFLNYPVTCNKERHVFLGDYFHLQVFDRIALFQRWQNLRFRMPYAGLRNFSEVLLLSRNVEFFGHYLEKYGVPCIPIYFNLDGNFTIGYLKSEGFKIQLVNDTQITFLRASKTEPEPMNSRIRPKDGQQLITFCNIMLTLCNIKLCSLLDKDPTVYFNSNHLIIKYWEDNYSKIEDNKELSNLFQGFSEQVCQQVRSAFFSIDNFVNTFKVNLGDINLYLQKINQVLSTSFHLSKNDFPEWMHSKITD